MKQPYRRRYNGFAGSAEIPMSFVAVGLFATEPSSPQRRPMSALAPRPDMVLRRSEASLCVISVIRPSFVSPRNGVSLGVEMTSEMPNEQPNGPITPLLGGFTRAFGRPYIC